MNSSKKYLKGLGLIENDNFPHFKVKACVGI